MCGRVMIIFFFFSSRRRHTRYWRDWSSDVCSSDLIPSEEIEHAFRTNIISMFHLCKAAIPNMHPGSAIINSTSIQAYQPTPVLLHYATTKGAIRTFTQGLAQELARSEEHTSELQSRQYLVCRLLLE